MKTLATSGHTAFQVHRSWYGQAGIGRSSWEGLSTGRHEKAQVRCPCSRFATQHGAPRTHGYRQQCHTDGYQRVSKNVLFDVI